MLTKVERRSSTSGDLNIADITNSEEKKTTLRISHSRDHKVEKTGDYELCFNNYFSVMEEKKVIMITSLVGCWYPGRRKLLMFSLARKE